MAIRIGIGFDVHRVGPGRKFILGGVDIPHNLGLAGHSDADVLVHAISDAILGAANMGDIGTLFPDSDPKYKDASSLTLLASVVQAIAVKGYTVNNVDATVAAEAPKIFPYYSRMSGNIANTIGLDPEAVSVKATTTEGLGYTGRGEGVAAWAVATVEKK